MMEMLSLNNDKIIVLDHEYYKTYYNTANGRIINVPKDYLDYLDDYFQINDFFGIPNTGICSIVTICINLTTKCNLRCKYCFNPKKVHQDLKLEDAINFIDSIVSFKPHASKYFVDLSGSGEPLLCLDKILSIAKYCNKKQDEIKKDIIVQFVTNGTLLTKEMAKILKEHKILFGFSIDGYKELHDRYRVDINGNGTFDKIISNYLNIENKDFIGCAMTFSDPNTDIYKAYLTMNEYFETISIRPARTEYKDFRIDGILEGYKKITSYIIKDAMLNKSILLLKKIINGDDFFGKMIVKVASNAYVNKRCDIGSSRFTIGADGNTYLCSAFVFDAKGKVDFRKELKLNNDFCDACNLKNFCGGICSIQRLNYEDTNALCKLKEGLFILATKLCAEIELNDMDVYSLFVEEVSKVLLRNNEDLELLDILENQKGKYSYSKLKEIKYTDEALYNALKQNLNY